MSSELATAGAIAVILAGLAGLAMRVCIWARFEWPFAVGAILTLVLGVVLTLGVFALSGLDFSLTAIAALSTLVGCSVNDKVVVCDRMRENLRALRKTSLLGVINLTINQTMTRSLYTSVTAFLAVLPLALWGGSAVASFAVRADGLRHRHCSMLVQLHRGARIAVPRALAEPSRHHDVCG